jgi:hypothetical protein
METFACEGESFLFFLNSNLSNISTPLAGGKIQGTELTVQNGEWS